MTRNAAIFGNIVVENACRAGMINAVGDATFAQKPTAKFSVDRRLGMENFDRHPVAVAMLRLVNGRHPAHRDKALEPVFAGEGRPHPRVQGRRSRKHQAGCTVTSPGYLHQRLCAIVANEKSEIPEGNSWLSLR